MPYRLVVLILMLLGVELTFAQASPAEEEQLRSLPELRWSACRDVPSTDCAGLNVPVDPARPDGARFTIRLGRVPATDPAGKKGVLLFIPGGPGVGISGVFGQFRGLQHIDDLARQYDVVSFDPRGIGQSSPIRCNPDTVPAASEPIYRPPAPAEFDALARANAAFFRTCFAATGELMAHLSAADTSNVSARRSARTTVWSLMRARTGPCTARPTWSGTAIRSRRWCSMACSTIASICRRWSRGISSRWPTPSIALLNGVAVTAPAHCRAKM
jgi:alpha/beta hydrolase fold